MSWQVLCGDARERLRDLPERSVQACVTSPPYFGLRSYGGGEQEMGTESTPDEFVAALVEVFREVRRVLRDDGTVWLNLGDSYSSLCAKPKDLLGIPWMVAFALRADGWYLRSEIIWAKPNPMPESVTDRPTRAHEQVFLLSKSPRYFYDADAIREDVAGEFLSSGARNPRYGRPGGMLPSEARGDDTPKTAARDEVGNGTMRRFSGIDPAGRNKRSVWTIATQPYKAAHFAVFPEKLIEPCILAGSSPQACGECGAPWERVVERQTVRETVGCFHDDDTGQSTVLDPFCGSGTTGVVALRHDRSFVGIDLNPEYVELARRRICDDAPLLNTHIETAA